MLGHKKSVSAKDHGAVKGEPILTLSDVCRSFEGRDVIKKINLTIKRGEFFTLVGPSGSGKTTILKMLAGMDSPSSGDIVYDNQSISSIPPKARPTCMVFQFLALFPHMTVGQNIEFPLKIKGVPAEERYDRACQLMSMVQLPEDYYAKNVMKCSGGERQRVAIARAFAYDPQILLFDEPLSAIDAKLRKTLQKELKALHEKSGKTFIYITHSLEEAMFMSDRVGVLNHGVLEQVGTPNEIYAHPNSRFTASFIGDTNIFPVRVRPEGGWESSELPLSVVLKVKQLDRNIEGYIIVRPERLRFLTDGALADNAIPAKIVAIYSLGSSLQYELIAGKKELSLQLSSAHAPDYKVGDAVTVGWDADDAIFVLN
ncbi:MAG: ABC transporter ATP-binding protein [Candidatus Anaerobiospirillum merdipullorum]|uniref:ABC transporter ATP-binding protein n=1 Tax=Candidatus Anaerobiospirillum merdipullorum TaxID=2838450 RepID=A0A9E2KP05_9GAMM|nr:ABC transporter ATP-binding protein [Candidatus Anaerobiospirillum merdipullorum]